MYDDGVVYDPREQERIYYSMNKRQLAYYKRNRDKVREYLRQYYHEHKEEFRQRSLIRPNVVQPFDEEDAIKLQIMENLKIVSKRKEPFERCRITKQMLAQILVDEAKRRAYYYLNKEKMKKILCIVGESGVGKTLCSLHLKNFCDANVICSFTTRPPRETEVEGRDHHFIDIVPPKEELLAYTIYGGYKYYATKSQVFGPCTVYVVDEKGLLDLKERFDGTDEFDIYSVYITRSVENRKSSGVYEDRMRRDATRTRLDLDFFNYILENNDSKETLFSNIERIYNEVKEK